MTASKRYSYFVLLATLVLAGWSGLKTPLITVVFSYFVLHQLQWLNRKWLTVLVFLALVSIIGLGLSYLVDQAIKTLPDVL